MFVSSANKFTSCLDQSQFSFNLDMRDSSQTFSGDMFKDFVLQTVVYCTFPFPSVQNVSESDIITQNQSVEI